MKHDDVVESSEPESTTAAGSVASAPSTASSPGPSPSPQAPSMMTVEASPPAAASVSPPVSPTLVEDSQADPVLPGFARGDSVLCHTASFEDVSDEAVVTKAGLSTGKAFYITAPSFSLLWCPEAYAGARATRASSHDSSAVDRTHPRPRENLGDPFHPVLCQLIGFIVHACISKHSCIAPALCKPRTTKRSRICLAKGKSRSLVGEATISDCLLVAVRGSEGQLMPPDDSVDGCQNFLLQPFNIPKRQITDMSILDSYAKVYAWVLTDVEKYPAPVPWNPPMGSVRFSNLQGRVPCDSEDAPCYTTSSKVTQ